MITLAILDTSTLGEDMDLGFFQQLGEVRLYSVTPPHLVEERIGDCDVVILNKVRLDETNLPAARRLKLICVTATGYDNIDTAYCKAHGIGVCNVQGYSTHSVAQLTLAMVLSLSCHLPQYHQYTVSGQYTQSGRHNCLTPVFHELYGKTWGILGYGAIGRQVGRTAEAMGCRVLACKRQKTPEAECVSLEELCRESDILTIHTPLTPETKGMIGRQELEWMKPSVILVNGARGAVWDEEAVADAVERGAVGGLGCDVYSAEPMAQDHPFQRIAPLPNVCLTPHMAWGAYEARVRCMEEVAENIRAFYRGELRNRVEG